MWWLRWSVLAHQLNNLVLVCVLNIFLGQRNLVSSSDEKIFYTLQFYKTKTLAQTKSIE
jgi:hypothetical protein